MLWTWVKVGGEAGALTLTGLLATPEAVAGRAHAGAGRLRRGQAELGAVPVVDTAGVGTLVPWGRGHSIKGLAGLLGTSVSGSCYAGRESLSHPGLCGSHHLTLLSWPRPSGSGCCEPIWHFSENQKGEPLCTVRGAHPIFVPVHWIAQGFLQPLLAAALTSDSIPHPLPLDPVSPSWMLSS